MVIAAAKQNVRLNPDAQHFLYAVLRWLGFQLAGSGDEGHQGDVHKERVLRTKLQAHLANRFEEGKRFNVADGAADFDNHNVDAFGDFLDSGLNFVGNVRDHLDGFAEVIAAALLDRKSTRLNSSHEWISYAVFCLKKKKVNIHIIYHQPMSTIERVAH